MRLNNAPHVWSSVVQESPSNHDQNSQSLSFSAVNNACKLENVNSSSLPVCKNETSVHCTYSSAQGGNGTHDSYVDVDTCDVDKKEPDQKSETKREPFKSEITPPAAGGSQTPLPSHINKMAKSKTDTPPTPNNSGGNS